VIFRAAETLRALSGRGCSFVDILPMEEEPTKATAAMS
jgi:hypothetical protein